MNSKLFTVSQAVKVVGVESHVLRFWEEQLGLSIARSELGHRIYTKEDVDTFLAVKEWKKQGLHLKEMVPLVAKFRGNADGVSGYVRDVNPDGLREKVENLNTDDLYQNAENTDADSRPENDSNVNEDSLHRDNESANADNLHQEVKHAYRAPVQNGKRRDKVSTKKKSKETKVDKEVEQQDEKLQQFEKIMKRVIRETIAESKSPEGRYKKVDATIRHHQRFRKLVAAARDEK